MPPHYNQFVANDHGVICAWTNSEQIEIIQIRTDANFPAQRIFLFSDETEKNAFF